MLHPTAFTIDTGTAEGRYAVVAGNWQWAWNREVQWALDRVGARIETHRAVQAKERAGVALTGYYANSAHSRRELVEAIRRARAVRAEFLARRPEPTLAQFAEREAA